MKRVQGKQAGFNIVELLVVIVVIGLIGTAGWLVYQHNRAKITGAAAGNQATNQQSSTTTTQPASTVVYLDIKEWGVKLPLSGSIKDAYYVVGISFSNSSDGLPGGVFLGLKSLTGAACNPYNNNNGGRGAIGAILRFLPTE